MRLGLLCLFFVDQTCCASNCQISQRNHCRTYHCTLDWIPKIFFRCLKMNSSFLKRPSKEWIDDTSFINGKEKNQEHACGKWQRWAWCKARKLFQQSIPFRGTLPAGTSGRREFQARHAWFTGKKAKQPQAHRFLPFEQLYFVKSQNITIDFYKQCLLIHFDIALLGIYIISFICIAEIHFEIWSYRIEIWQVTIIALLEPYFQF